MVAVERDVILVRHGSAYYRRHPHHLRRRTVAERGEAGDPSGAGPEEKREGEIVCTGPRPAEFKPTEGTTLDRRKRKGGTPLQPHQNKKNTQNHSSRRPRRKMRTFETKKNRNQLSQFKTTKTQRNRVKEN